MRSIFFGSIYGVDFIKKLVVFMVIYCIFIDTAIRQLCGDELSRSRWV